MRVELRLGNQPRRWRCERLVGIRGMYLQMHYALPLPKHDQMWSTFYRPHRKAANPLYDNDCFYTPNVCVFKSDTNFPEPLPKEDCWSVNILTCAAPNLCEHPSNMMNPYAGNVAAKITPSELEKLLTARIRRIFEIAVTNGTRC